MSGQVLARRPDERSGRLPRRDQDPLPVFKVGGIVRLNADDLNDWLSHQRDRSLGRPLGEGFVDTESHSLMLVA